MSWRESLIKLADLEVETLQKRLKEIADKRAAVEMMLTSLDREARQESMRAKQDAEAGWYLIGFREGMKVRRAKLDADLNACKLEEQGARDALATAFENQKKYERVAETARLAVQKEAHRREGLALDELALRRTGTW